MTNLSRKDPIIYIGYDEREDVAYNVCEQSIRKYASHPITIVPLKEPELRRAGLYRRSHFEKNGQKFDTVDGRPFSTDFSFTRFLVPHLNQYEGPALFMDCDMLVLDDIWEVIDEMLFDKTDKALWCVKHNYKPTNSVKMDNKIQEVYNRKNWSSFMLFDCGHPSHKKYTVDDVNLKSGSWLHNFSWLADDEIGSLNESWNWLDGWSNEGIRAKNAHFTTGGPWFDNWEPSREIDSDYADIWRCHYEEYKLERNLMEMASE